MNEFEFLSRLKIKIEYKDNITDFYDKKYERTEVSLYYKNDEGRLILIDSDFADKEVKS